MNDTLRCTGTSKQSGQRCKRTRCPGLDKCSLHCGLSREDRQLAAETAEATRLARIELARLDVRPIVNPLPELQHHAAVVVAWRDTCSMLLNRLDPDQLRYAGNLRGEQVRAEVAMWESSLTAAQNALTALHKCTSDEVLLQLEVRQADLVAAALTKALRRLSLEPEVETDVRTDFARALRSIGRTADEAGPDEVLSGVVIPPGRTVASRDGQR